ncbi:MAG: PEP/pyruvate-binding domain-containing protein [Elusimicrobiales bacterium]|nr:PEP/pyruvate-binding domain-containing protein [Elusimicrobiales bacterium]
MPTSKKPGDYEIEFGGFEKLMPHRIKNVLLVASLYDSFLLADDDRLNEALFGELPEAGRGTPKITRVPTTALALEKVKRGNYDLVIAMIQVGETDMADFFRGLKAGRPDLPVVLLSFNVQDIKNIPDSTMALADGVCLWSGDTKIFSAIINIIEDARNFDQDSKVGVQAVLLVEDNIKFYSSYLPIIYTELLKQTQVVMAEELNPVKKSLRLRARPKILFCSTYEEAWALYEKYKSNLLGVITDIEYPMGGACHSEAGLELARRIKADSPDMPVLLQSSNAKYAQNAGQLEASFMHKAAPDLAKQLRAFIQRYFGFGDFVFSDTHGMEMARAADLHTMLKLLKVVPIDSIIYHASRNHFSKWLLARTEFEMAYHIRPKKISEFGNPEELRKYLIETMHQFIYKTQLGTVLKFDRRLFDDSAPFSKIGAGSIGGKARGLAFVDFLLSKTDLEHRWPDVTVTVPNTVVIASDVFDFFMEQNGLDAMMNENRTNDENAALFERARLPDYVMRDLAAIVDKLDGPLAVRSSSLLEDSKTQPFAGVYKTYMLANNHPDPARRLDELARAVKFIYASVFSREARAYRRLNPLVIDEEKMAVMIQRVVGHDYGGGRHYPAFAGVMQSYNYYPVPPLGAEDPIAHIALGLGKTIVEGYTALRFSPAHPQNLHQFSTLQDFLANSQKQFVALKTGREEAPLRYEEEPALFTAGVEEAEADGSLQLVGSTYSAENDRIYDGISEPGRRLITFAPLLKNDVLPLAEILRELSEMGKDAMGCNIEMEFACDYDPATGAALFNIVQMRPMVSRSPVKKVSLKDLKPESLLCLSAQALGNGAVREISDLVYVIPEKFDPLKTREIAEEIGELNARLRAEGRSYIVLGPGRWGSSDPALGIPVKWHHINGSRIIIEAAYGDFVVDPSYGTHFFHNVTSLGIGYFTIHATTPDAFINWDKLLAEKPLAELKYIRHLRFPGPLDIRIDGSEGRAAVAI